jgi:hypothetical protein
MEPDTDTTVHNEPQGGGRATAAYASSVAGAKATAAYASSVAGAKAAARAGSPPKTRAPPMWST